MKFGSSVHENWSVYRQSGTCTLDGLIWSTFWKIFGKIGFYACWKKVQVLTENGPIFFNIQSSTCYLSVKVNKTSS